MITEPTGAADVSHPRSLAEIDAETIGVCRHGSYRAPSGEEISIAGAVRSSVEGTYLVREGDPAPAGPDAESVSSRVIEVTREKTGEACARLAAEGLRVAALNFANGTHPGGGFRQGARAQEEQLCRCSALYACLDSDRDDARAFYAEQAGAHARLALDHVLVSPAVPFFRSEDFTFLPAPFSVTVLTCAAPNLRWLRTTPPEGRVLATSLDEVRRVLHRRARRIVDVACAVEVDAVVLGAWGCGVFGNDPDIVSAAFIDALSARDDAPRRVVFAVYGGDEANHRAFASRVDSPTGSDRTRCS